MAPGELQILKLILCVLALVPTLPLCDSTEEPGAARCLNNPVTVCQALDYNSTIMPNFAGHTNLIIAELDLHAYTPLLQYGCSSQLPLLLCSVYIPVCSGGRAVPPCRDLCTSVRARCLPVLHSFLIRWPEVLDCARFPELRNGNCVENPEAPTTPPPSVTVPAIYANVSGVTPRCQPIQTGMCKGYSHDVIKMAEIMTPSYYQRSEFRLQQYGRLFDWKCAKRLSSYLCAQYYTLLECSADADIAVPPCEHYCYSIRRHCERMELKSKGLEWPLALNCSIFPATSSSDAVCAVAVSSTTRMRTDWHVLLVLPALLCLLFKLV